MYNEGKRNYLYLLKQETYFRNKAAGADILDREFLYIHETTFQSYVQKTHPIPNCCSLVFSCRAVNSRGFDYSESF